MLSPYEFEKKYWSRLHESDPEIFQMIEDELQRQNEGLEMIASENFASVDVLCAMSSILSNKYAEGLPGKRYYGGCVNVDRIESLAIARVCDLFGAKFANVQPHSGAQANAAVYLALCKAGDKILGLDLTHGGHLTHGSKVNFSGILYESHFYELDEHTQRLNYDKIQEKAREIRPKIIVGGASAYPRTIDFKKLREIADSVEAYLFVDMAHIAGLVAAGEHPSPIPHAHVITSTTHKTLRGPRGGIILWNDEKLTAQINKAVFPGTQGGPLEHVIAAKAVCFKEAKTPAYKKYQKQVKVNAHVLAEALKSEGFSLVSDGTDNHIVLLDFSKDDVTGKEMELLLDEVGITANKNTVPYEKRSPFVTSGVRLGTPALTTRGMKEPEMKLISSFIKRAYQNRKNPENLKNLHQLVLGLAKEFPLYKVL